MNKKVAVGMALLIGITVFAGGMELKQQNDQNKVPTVGILQYVKHPALDAIHQGIDDELARNGYHNGKNIKIDYQNAQGDQSNLKTMATRFSDEHATISVGIATPAAVALANTVQNQPVIFSAVTDPVGSKLLTNEQRPNGNVTGVSDKAPLKQQLKLMRNFVPQMKTMGVIYTSSDDSASSEAKRMIKLASAAGIKVKAYSISSSNDLNQTSQQMVANHQVDAVFVPTDNTIAGAMPTLIKNTNAQKVPVFPTVDTMVSAGGVAASSINQHELGVMTGKMIVQELKGKKPHDLPVESVKTGRVVVNRKQAMQMGVHIPKEYQNAKEVGGDK
ncbi:putative ABC transport system substrate-binding protein [Weissella uvarum]|uniref:tryptophan ABC transporter substrate-binding protein n=1 Tax=Weissella uvarum TaxID=1479233 RepID=UPI00195FE29B|nr:tryptophan ABC transporter substrate-binding protein [Weissella uvarum]MBM7617821.1 putative ABC transport system substrate-binding protein [Weissella uvarum]MCM0595800.1 ABC transporter substrate-binding protein [Weissella uvarum]